MREPRLVGPALLWGGCAALALSSRVCIVVSADLGAGPSRRSRVVVGVERRAEVIGWAGTGVEIVIEAELVVELVELVARWRRG